MRGPSAGLKAGAFTMGPGVDSFRQKGTFPSAEALRNDKMWRQYLKV